MYSIVVALHNIVRWFVVVLGIFTTIKAFHGWFTKKDWSDAERKAGIFFTAIVDLQLLIGILLYFILSNWGIKAILEKGVAFIMRQGEFRFFAIEHGIFMLFGVIFAHLGGILPKKVDNSQQKYKRAAIWFGLALLAIIAGIPWFSRPLFPGL